MNNTSNVARHPATTQSLKNVIAVASGKGGVGKTWFSITITHALAKLGRKTLLFDGDLGLANVDVQLGLMPEHDIANVIAGKIEAADAVQTYEDGPFDVLAGRSGSGSLAALTPPKFKSLRDGLVTLAPAYESVVLDLAAGVDDNLRMLVALSSTCLVITTDEPTALTDAYALIKVLTAAGRQNSIRVVVNMAASQQDGQSTYRTLLKACESFLKISPPLAGIIRRDDKVRDTIRRQTPIMTRHPASNAADDVAAIASRLTQSEER
jgi:flagellar biosynthesis protein FlhG